MPIILNKFSFIKEQYRTRNVGTDETRKYGSVKYGKFFGNVDNVCVVNWAIGFVVSMKTSFKKLQYTRNLR